MHYSSYDDDEDIKTLGDHYYSLTICRLGNMISFKNPYTLSIL